MFFLVLIPNYVVRKKNMQDNAGQNPAAIWKSATFHDNNGHNMKLRTNQGNVRLYTA